jgi:hypothetical protein
MRQSSWVEAKEVVKRRVRTRRARRGRGFMDFIVVGWWLSGVGESCSSGKKV